jgi:anaerobic sulfite reductase subunit C
MEDVNHGYPTIGARNIRSCIGNSQCIKANVNTWELARKLEPLIFPSHYHIKIALAGCPNDCSKAHFTDFGILGMAKTTYHRERCIGCGACVKACEHHSTRVLSLNEDKFVDKDECCCIGCGECVLACPASAWVRKPTKFYRMILGGRTGKQTPRMGQTFLSFVTEEVVLGVIGNWHKFSAWALDYKPEYLHGGHLIDRAGYETFKEHILEGVELNPEALVAEHIYWHETEYRSLFNIKPLNKHQMAGPSVESRH